MSEPPVSSQFQDSLVANLAFWQARVQGLPESQFAILDPETQNLFRAVEFGLELAPARDAALQLVLHLIDYVEWRGLWRAWIPVFERARALFSETHPLWGQLACRLGFLYRLDGQVQAALARHQEALRFAKAAGDTRETALAALGLADEYYLLYQYEQAEANAQAGIAGLLIHGETTLQVRAAYNLRGMIAHARGAYEEAAAHYKTALAAWPSENAPNKQAQILTNYANSLRELGRSAEAHTALTQAVALLEARDSRLPLVYAQLALGMVHFSQGDYPGALTVFATIDQAFLRRFGYLQPLAHTLNNLGNARLALKQYVTAAEYLMSAAQVWRVQEEQVQLANTLGDLGEACFHQGLTDQAGLHWEEALALLAAHLVEHPEDAWARRLERGTFARRAWLLQTR